MTVEEAAKELAGNWKTFDSFCWSRGYELPDADSWAIVYTHNRDSTLTGKSNAVVIERELSQFAEGDDPDLVFESHDHWLCGHVDGFSVRVYRGGAVTDAFRAVYELKSSLDSYALLDESDYCAREHEATLGHIKEIGWYARAGDFEDYELPDGWEKAVWKWLWDNEQGELEDVDDTGGFPVKEAVLRAFTALGYRPPDEDEGAE